MPPNQINEESGENASRAAARDEEEKEEEELITSKEPDEQQEETGATGGETEVEELRGELSSTGGRR